MIKVLLLLCYFAASMTTEMILVENQTPLTLNYHKSHPGLCLPKEMHATRPCATFKKSLTFKPRRLTFRGFKMQWCGKLDHLPIMYFRTASGKMGTMLAAFFSKDHSTD